MSQATKHANNCNHSFGRRTPGCARCAELASGAAPRAWHQSSRATADARLIAEIRAHVCTAACGPVCVRFDY